MYFSKIALVCLVVVGSGVNARPQVADYSAITDESDPRFMFDTNPQYKFKYQVADDPEQTYISHNEERDGAAVTGQYSYVDALGSLITVTYQAGDEGYTEQRQVQENFLTIRARPVKPVAPVPQPRPAPRPTPPPRNTNDDLIASIIRQLTPFIKETVSSSLGSRSTQTTRVVEVQQPRVEVLEVQPVATGTTGIFGADGQNRIQVETNAFNFDHFLS